MDLSRKKPTRAVELHVKSRRPSGFPAMKWLTQVIDSIESKGIYSPVELSLGYL
jgi:hypothetical protein